MDVSVIPIPTGLDHSLAWRVLKAERTRLDEQIERLIQRRQTVDLAMTEIRETCLKLKRLEPVVKEAESEEAMAAPHQPPAPKPQLVPKPAVAEKLPGFVKGAAAQSVPQIRIGGRDDPRVVAAKDRDNAVFDRLKAALAQPGAFTTARGAAEIGGVPVGSIYIILQRLAKARRLTFNQGIVRLPL